MEGGITEKQLLGVGDSTAWKVGVQYIYSEGQGDLGMPQLQFFCLELHLGSLLYHCPQEGTCREGCWEGHRGQSLEGNKQFCCSKLISKGSTKMVGYVLATAHLLQGISWCL